MPNYTFTQEQLEAAKTAESHEDLVAKAKEQGYEITLEQAASFLDGQSAELADEELDNVAGGACSTQAWEADGRTYPVKGNPKHRWGKNYSCASCCSQLVYARQKIEHDGQKQISGSLYVICEYVDVKCYKCNQQFARVMCDEKNAWQQWY